MDYVTPLILHIHNNLRRPIVALVSILLVALLLLPRVSHAQLISPGKLIEAHSDLEGINNCTQCHTLGNRSADNMLCLDCHTPLSNRINTNSGFHATVSDQNCASCHKEHFGVEFDAVRFDTLAFDHNETGFDLTGSHAEARCRNCHQPELIVAEDVIAFKGEHGTLDHTFLGVSTTCIGCHSPDSPHENQFPEVNCDTCHDSERWEDIPFFDHDETNFALTGLHVDVECSSCHETIESPQGIGYVQYLDLDFATCASCHEDEHQGAFGTACSSCHSTSGWNEIANLADLGFDHSSTGFDLVGSHQRLECASCHGKPARNDDIIALTFTATSLRNTYPVIPVENCASCHVDYHEGSFDESSEGLSCDQCHSEEAWYPSSFGITQHNERSTFELTGAHLATPCSSCHNTENTEKPHFEFSDTSCETCHVNDNPHGSQFVAESNITTCNTCHTTEEWQTAPLFDHELTDFPLTGVHQTTLCSSCHSAEQDPSSLTEVIGYRNTETACISCHEPDNPHADQFENTTCNTCHNTSSFYITSFDHDQTAFPLTGEHVDLSCISCHLNEADPGVTPFIRFKPLGTACQDCHSDQ